MHLFCACLKPTIFCFRNKIPTTIHIDWSNLPSVLYYEKWGEKKRLKECPALIRHLVKNFSSWTSGNKDIDKVIQDTQINFTRIKDIMEWIPYEEFKEINFIARGGYGKVSSAKWPRGYIEGYSLKKRRVKRYRDTEVVLKAFIPSDEDERKENTANDQKSTSNTFCTPITSESTSQDTKCENKKANFLSSFIKELKFYKDIESNLVTRCYGVTKNPEDGMYILVLQRGGQSLREFNRSQISSGKLDWDFILDSLDDIMMAISNMHRLNIIHRDLHSGNILMADNNYEKPSKRKRFRLNIIRRDLHSENISMDDNKGDKKFKASKRRRLPDTMITDLGLCRPIDEPIDSKSIFGIPVYMAPEILNGQPHTKASDIYSIGTIMYELARGFPPFADKDYDTKAVKALVRQGIKPDPIPGIPTFYEETMLQCWNNDPAKRPTAMELETRFHEWFYAPNRERSIQEQIDQANEYLKKNPRNIHNIELDRTLVTSIRIEPEFMHDDTNIATTESNIGIK
ncbi:kinase-like domain-containing protein [Rhizophagus clarus]|uniref:Kinase-like domain-containing protein n=1 Tax=Rhizophagus clarus TaxID=94130 RepID=A0A8H3QYW0_9GLOM|nr:kinase-like domain-containing protein [Rhizophagus clarus]